MSSAARWSYTSPATLWPHASDAAWKGAPAFGAPVAFLCDYKAEAKLMTSARGQEFIAKQQLYTERTGIKPGDRVLIGSSTAPDPIAAGAHEVMLVTRFADTLDGKADDFMVVT